ncbi:HET domain-containing protein [Fusarium falciforme]|uniref:HET domain-containing protein n=1 Tax=Fusarium falciforme TaxID=195108 RepID=UPI0023006496|nr:HET domain-containing protein [Fusarium falciforme]WAO95767.1 HET domain-containing protein [Fusarium falciforme]
MGRLGDPAAALGLPVLNTHLTNTKSTETFQFIQACLDECSAHDCKSPLRLETSQSAPSRLLDVDNTVRLIDVGNVCPPYVALSHCWGTNLSKYMTVWANLAQKKTGIDWNALTLTFCDAIETTRRLKLRYIWIDALQRRLGQ